MSSSSGLGISYQSPSSQASSSSSSSSSALVPSPTRHSPHKTAFNYPPRSSPSRLPPPPSSAGGRTSPLRLHRPRGAPGVPPTQPAFALRPTHTRGGTSNANGFSSFSVIASTATAASQQTQQTQQSQRPIIPSNHSHQYQHQRADPGSSSVASRANTIATDSTELHIPPVNIDYADCQTDMDPERSITPSTRSTGTTASRTTPKRSVSGDLLRKFSKASTSETISGGPYIPIPGQDPVPAYEEKDSTPPSPSPDTGGFTRSDTLSSVVATPAQSIQQSIGPSPPLEINGSFMPSSFPAPPARAPQTGLHPGQAGSAPGSGFGFGSGSGSGPASNPVHGHRRLPRSYTMPQHLSIVPEASSRGNSMCLSDEKRLSDISTGVHSKNAALLSAESGGMLAFSPSNGGVWRMSEMPGVNGTPLSASALASASPSSSASRSQITVGKPKSEAESREDELKSRPWSDSTMSHHRPRHGRSLSDGLLARQGTLLHPASNTQRASQELGLLLGGRSRRPSQGRLLPPPQLSAWQPAGGEGADHVRLEAAKKRKARVEVVVVLERECVVEGGEIRGRMDVRINGGRRGEGLRVGGGKVRVIGFEDIGCQSRHIFYHVAHPLPLFAHPPALGGPMSSLFASPADDEGYRLAAEGVHSIPFRLRLPLGGGAKGSFTSPSRGPSVRYVVVGSIKLYIPSTGKRSIAHFYRSIVVLPYLNPGVVLAPSAEPVEVTTEKGLGWSITGEKGQVAVKVALGRRTWVSGQRIWFEVGIRNDSTKKIKALNLALLQNVESFESEALLDPSVGGNSTGVSRRKVTEEIIEADPPDYGGGRVTGKDWWTGVDPGERGHWDLSLLVPPGMITIARSRLVQVTYTLRVTLNSSIYVDVPIELINFLSIDPPPMPGDGARMLSASAIRQPIDQLADDQNQLVVEIGPGPYGASGMRGVRADSDGNASVNSISGAARASSTTLHIDALLQAGRARASAQGLDGILPPTAAAAQSARSRQFSVASDYTPPASHAAHTQFQSLSLSQSQSQDITNPNSLKQRPTPTRPQANWMTSYISINSGEADAESMDPMSEEDEEDKAALAAARREGRKLSLAIINRAIDREHEDMFRHTEGVLTPTRESPPGEEYLPLDTPVEEVYNIIGETSSIMEGGKTPMTVPSSSRALQDDVVPALPELVHSSFADEVDEQLTPKADKSGALVDSSSQVSNHRLHSDRQDQAGQGQGQGPYDDVGEEGSGAGDGNALDDLAPGHEAEEDTLQAALSRYDYGEDIERSSRHRDDVDDAHADAEAQAQAEVERESSLRVPDRRGSSLSPSPGHPYADEIALIHRVRGERMPSFAPSFVSEQESEVGQVHHAIKRNLSIKIPSATIDLDDDDDHEAILRSHRGLGVGVYADQHQHENAHGRGMPLPRSGSIPTLPLRLPLASPSDSAQFRRDSSSPRGSPRKAETPNTIGHSFAGSVPRTSSVTSQPSPLRPVAEVDASRGGGGGTMTDEHEPEHEHLKANDESRTNTNTHTFGPSSGVLWANRPSFSFDAAPLRIKHRDGSRDRDRSHSPRASSSPISPRAGMSISPGPSPRTTQSKQLAHLGQLGADAAQLSVSGRKSSATSHLRHQISPDDLSSEEAGPPGLAPSVASDSGSSDGHALESPPGTTMSTAPIHPAIPDSMGKKGMATRGFAATGEKPLPSLPFLSVTQTSPPMDDPNWMPGDHMRLTQVALSQSTTTLSLSQLPPIPPLSPLSPEPTSPVMSLSRPSTPSSSNHSILPGVAAKLAQLESREEALRKFSVASAASGGGTGAGAGAGADSTREMSHASGYSGVDQGQGQGRNMSVASANMSHADHGKISVISATSGRPSFSYTQDQAYGNGHGHGYQSPYHAASGRDGVNVNAPSTPLPPLPDMAVARQVAKRRSYTTVLAPRPSRSQSDDVLDGSVETSSRVGHTTYVAKRTYGDPWAVSPDPYKSVSNRRDATTGDTHAQPQEVGTLGGGAPGLGLSRNLSNASTSTTATSIEKALMARPGGPRSPPAPMRLPAAGQLRVTVAPGLASGHSGYSGYSDYSGFRSPQEATRSGTGYGGLGAYGAGAYGAGAYGTGYGGAYGAGSGYAGGGAATNGAEGGNRVGGYSYGYDIEGSAASRASVARTWANPPRVWEEAAKQRGSVGGETDESEGLL